MWVQSRKCTVGEDNKNSKKNSFLGRQLGKRASLKKPRVEWDIPGIFLSFFPPCPDLRLDLIRTLICCCASRDPTSPGNNPSLWPEGLGKAGRKSARGSWLFFSLFLWLLCSKGSPRCTELHNSMSWVRKTPRHSQLSDPRTEKKVLRVRLRKILERGGLGKESV